MLLLSVDDGLDDEREALHAAACPSVGRPSHAAAGVMDRMALPSAESYATNHLQNHARTRAGARSLALVVIAAPDGWHSSLVSVSVA